MLLDRLRIGMVTVEITGVQDRSVHKSPKLEKTANVVTEINEGPTQRKGGGNLQNSVGVRFIRSLSFALEYARHFVFYLYSPCFLFFLFFIFIIVVLFEVLLLGIFIQFTVR